jgi:hypothetical protein
MRIFLIILLVFIAVPGVCEESNSGTWTYSTGLKIISVNTLKAAPEKPNWRIEHKGTDYIATISDYFFRENNFEEPLLSISREGKVTLTARTKRRKIFRTKDEYPLQLTIKISGKRLHKGETVYFYNGDYGEVMGHQVIR